MTDTMTRYQRLKRETYSKGYADGYQQAMSEIARLIEDGEPRAAISQWVSTAVGREIVTLCSDCVSNAQESAYENWRDDRGREPSSADDEREINEWAREYVRSDISTPCLGCRND